MYPQLKNGNNISLIPEPAALCMHGFAMFMTFSSFLIHPAGQWYDTQQLGESIRYTSQLQIWHQPVTIQKPEITENIITSFSIINHKITSKIKSLNYSFITAKFHFFNIKTDKIIRKTNKSQKFPKNGKNRLNNFLKVLMSLNVMTQYLLFSQ